MDTMSPALSRTVVSVVVPFKSTGDRIVRLCKALADQTYPRELLEFIIVDDGSGVPVDLAVGDAVSSFHNLTIIRNPATLGRARSRNIGARIARGDILVFVDSDDVPSRGYIRAIVSRLGPSVGVVLRTNIRIDPSIRRRSLFARFQDARYIGGRIAAGAFPHDVANLPPKFLSTQGLAIKRNDFESLGGFDEGFAAYGGEDEEFGLRLHGAGFTLAFSEDALIWDCDDRISLARMCERIPEYVLLSLGRVVERYPEYVNRSWYARIAYGEDILTRIAVDVLAALHRLRVTAMTKWILAKVDHVSWLSSPHRLYGLVIASEVAAARIAGGRPRAALSP